MIESGKAELKVIGPLAGIIGLFGMLAIVALFSVADQVNGTARAREQSVVASGLWARVQELEREVAAEVTEAGAAPAAALTEALSRNVGIERTYVLNGAGELAFGLEGGAEASAESYAGLAAAAAPIIEEAMSGGELSASAPAIQSSDFVRIGEQVFILTASRFGAEAGAPLVVTAEAVDQTFLNTFTSRYLLTDPVLTTGPVAAERARAPLTNLAGETVAALAWTPALPGKAMLNRTLPLVLFAVFSFAASALILFRRGRKAANNLMISEARAKHMALHDPLTGLPNRLLFTDRLNAAVDHYRRGKGEVSVLCIDLDRFKDVNDTLGHQCGDELIIEAAERLRSVCRKTDTLARLGGDEFAIVMHEDARGAAAAASRVLEALNLPADLTGGRVFLAGSVGVAVINESATEGHEALRQADVALYRAKAAGRGQYFFFEPEMDAALKVRRSLESDLRAALDANELTMVYQPQVGRNGKVFGVEALVRWTHPIRGAVSPGFFVPIAEESGLIDQLGMFTIRQAFTDSLQWPNLRVAVNVSAKQISMVDFPDRLAALIEETGAEPTRIELEITEGLLLGDDHDTHNTLTRLRSMGFSLALDDFGTGYSSLAYLRRYPIDQIKIDRSFVASLGVDSEAEDVIKAMIKLARAMNLSIIAEGVETPEQHKRLAAVGCSRVQGFLYSRPVPAGDIVEMLKTGTLKAVPPQPRPEAAEA